MTKDTVHVFMTGLAFGESPRWHDGRLWFSNWGAQEIIAVDLKGKSEVVVRLPFPSFPFSIDWLPDGRLLIISSSDQPLVRQESDGSLVPHADLSRGFNEIVVDGRGNAYMNGAGFNPLAYLPGVGQAGLPIPRAPISKRPWSGSANTTSPPRVGVPTCSIIRCWCSNWAFALTSTSRSPMASTWPKRSPASVI